MSEGTSIVPVKRGRGRPKGVGSKYTPEIAKEIVDRICEGETLLAVCRQHRDGTPREPGSFPTSRIVHDWADPTQPHSHIDFVAEFARARLEQQRTWLEETIDIANTPEPGFEEIQEHSSKSGVTIRRARKDMLHHRMLKIDTRLKAIARLNPQLWSERLQQAAGANGSQGDDGSTRIVIEGGLPDEEPSPIPSPGGASEDDASSTGVV